MNISCSTCSEYSFIRTPTYKRLTVVSRSRGVILSPSVVPIGLTVTWSKLTRAGVFSGCILGAILGMLAWMIGCWKIYGEFLEVVMLSFGVSYVYPAGVINIQNLAKPYSAVCSGLTGLLVSGVVTVLVSWIRTYGCWIISNNPIYHRLLTRSSKLRLQRYPRNHYLRHSPSRRGCIINLRLQSPHPYKPRQ